MESDKIAFGVTHVNTRNCLVAYLRRNDVTVDAAARTENRIASQEPFQQEGVNEMRRQLKGPQEVSFALAQRQGGEALDLALTTQMEM